jgi:hypothetical protein
MFLVFWLGIVQDAARETVWSDVANHVLARDGMVSRGMPDTLRFGLRQRSQVFFTNSGGGENGLQEILG